MSNHKPSVTDLLVPASDRSLVYRPPRPYTDKDGKVQYDSPQGRSLNGKMFVALGMCALGFAAASIRRVRLEKSLILQMWKANTTIKGLRTMAAAGEPLPPAVLIRGQLKIRGEPVPSIISQVPQLRPLLGQIDQPANFFIDLALRVKSGEVQLPKGFETLGDGVEDIEDDFTKRTTVLAQNLAVAELLVTRLGCEATRKETKNKNGKIEIKITRKPRAARFNVLHHRRVAEGLHVVGTEGESADLVLPEYGLQELQAGDSPTLFLSLPDALKEFKQYFSGVWNILNADKPMTHLSKFMHLDQSSSTDDGQFLGKERARQSTSSLVVPGLTNSNALDSLGQLIPNGWLWSGKGFYDNRVGDWASFGGVEQVNYEEFRARVPVAARENARHQEATEWSRDRMERERNKENCFRVAELGISVNSDVVVLGKPQLLLASGRGGGGGLSQSPEIAIVSPEVDATSVLNARFLFRILKGHTLDNLIKHRNGSLLVYLGLAAMGAFTVAAGEEMIRDSLEVTYL